MYFLKTFVDLNNPVLIFRCDKEFIKERLFFANDTKPFKSELNNERKKQINSYSDVKEDFIKMMNEPDPNLLLFPRKPKILEEKIIDNLENIEEVNEYTDTLTTWVIVTGCHNFKLIKKLKFYKILFKKKAL